MRISDFVFPRFAGMAALCLLLGAACDGPIANDDSAHGADAAQDEGRGSSVWGANYFPNITLTTHDGEKVRFFDDLIKDKVVAINFIYTSCPDACPMETARLLEVQRLLGDRAGEDVHFYSISIDPETDTPEVLHDYVERWGIGDGWTFLTGDEADIVLLRKKLGVYIEDIQAKDSKDHNLNLVIGNQKTGRWMRRSPYENPYILATQLGSWLHNWKLPPQGDEQSYENAPELRQIGSGENLWRTRCVSCHTIGQGDVSVPEERRVGPDLYNISKQRDRDWLESWLAAPDKMIAEGDPIATALVEQYRGVKMPNLRLNELDVRHIIEFIDSESERIDAELEARAAVAPAIEPLPPVAVEPGSEDVESTDPPPCH